MNPLALQWIVKAEGDFTSAQREYRARKNPNYDSACFHAQQCVEKYLKAVLQDREIPFRKTHDLNLLFDLLLPDIPETS
ncbi:MAG: HEPN domain-containing protein [Thermoguttaceae bacterium]